jgi:hypothetical protein
MQSVEAGRFAARLASLPSHVVVEVAVCALTEGRAAAEALIAQQAPFPDWALTNVLLSADLLPRILSVLDMTHGSASAVCAAWQQAWNATSDQRRGLRAAPALSPEFDVANLAVLGGSPELQWVSAVVDKKLLVLDAQMRVQHRIDIDITLNGQYEWLNGECDTNDLCISAERIYIARRLPARVTCLDATTFTQLAEHVTVDTERCRGCVGISLGQGVLFALEVGPQYESVVVLDDKTLAVRAQIDTNISITSIAAVGDSVIGIEESQELRLHMFSKDGVALREIVVNTASWLDDSRRFGQGFDAHSILLRGYFDGRLYLVQPYDDAAILVLDLDGERMQVWNVPAGMDIESATFSGRQLVVALSEASDDSGDEVVEVVALKGI